MAGDRSAGRRVGGSAGTLAGGWWPGSGMTFDLSEGRGTRDEGRARFWPLLAFGFTFLAFFPYPAVALGSATGLQLNQMMAFALTPLILLLGLPTRQTVVLSALMGTMIISAFLGLATDRILVSEIMVKAIVAMLVAAIVLIPAGYFATSANLVAVVGGAAAAILVHAVVGAYQIYSFGQGTFPFLGIYRNPSFVPLTEVAEDYALYIRRPFGLFPEPSAMTSSTGPWLVILAGLLLHPHFRKRLSRPVRVLFLLAVVAGSYLVIQARSGYAPLWLAMMLPVVALSPISREWLGSVRSPRFVTVIAVGTALFAIAVLLARGQVNNESVSQNDSWASRQESIVIALTAPSRDPVRFLVGYGPGQAATYVLNNATVDLLPNWYKVDKVEPVTSIWSVLGTIYMEMGVLGAILIVGLLVALVRAIQRSSAQLIGYCTLGAWLAGVTVTTSYFPLSPIWLCMSLLLVWDKVFVLQPATVVKRTAMATPGFNRERRVAAGVSG